MNFKSLTSPKSPSYDVIQSDIQQYRDLLCKVKSRIEQMKLSSQNFAGHLELLDSENLIDCAANPVLKSSFLEDEIKSEMH